MAITTTTEFAAEVNNDLQMNMLRNIKPRCPYFVGSTSAEVSMGAETYTAKWIKIADMTPTTTALTELTATLAIPTRAATQLTRSTVTAAVAKYGAFVYLTEEVDLKAISAQSLKITEVLGVQAGRSLNRLQRNELEDNGTIRQSNGVASDVLTTTAFLAADANFVVNALERNSALTFTALSTGSQNIGTTPILASYWGICHTDVAHDIVNLTGFKSVESYAGQVQIANGEFGFWPQAGAGIRFVSTPEASIDVDTGIATASAPTLRANSTNVDLYPTTIFGIDYHGSVGLGMQHVKEIYNAGDPLPAVQIISHGRGSSGVGDALNEVASVGWKSWHVAKILDTSFGRTVRSGATAL